jgi:hypothetical protein
MRKIILSLGSNPAESEVNALKVMLEASPEEGYTLGQVRSAIRLLDKVNGSADGVLMLEEPEYEFLLARFNAQKFGRATRAVVELADKIANAQHA